MTAVRFGDIDRILLAFTGWQLSNSGQATISWDRRYRNIGSDGAGVAPGAARVLRDFAHLLPPQGDALDLACGLGGNALFMAARGLRVSAWDSSAVAIDGLRCAAVSAGLAVDAAERDVLAEPPAANSFDVIVVSRYLERSLAPVLLQALRPGGLLYYQTFIVDRVGEHGPRNPDYRLQPNELLQLFAGLRVLAYREEGRVGDLEQGFRDEAMLVAGRE